MHADPSLTRYTAGSAEPWTVDVLTSLIRGLRSKHVLELGAFHGLTTVELAKAAAPHGGQVVAVELDAGNAAICEQTLRASGLTNVTLVQGDALRFLRELDCDPFDFAFVDDDHTYGHVAAELTALRHRMAPSGLITMHDVVGVFGLAPLVYQHGGIVLPLPLLHAAGGLGIIPMPSYQVFNATGEAVTVSHMGHGL